MKRKNPADKTNRNIIPLKRKIAKLEDEVSLLKIQIRLVNKILKNVVK